jgi:hypothetical protein
MVIENLRKRLNLPPKQRNIHVQPVKKQKLENCFVGWEKGNYLFLQGMLEENRVSLTAPSLFSFRPLADDNARAKENQGSSDSESELNNVPPALTD